MLFPFLLLEILVFWLHQSHAQTLCNSTVLVDNQQKTVYRLSGTSLDLIAGNTTRIGWTLERNDSSGQQVLQIGSNFAYPNGSATQLLRIQLIGSDLDAAKFRYFISSLTPGAPLLFLSNFVSITIGTAASITKTNLSDNGTVRMFERTQRTIHIESEGLPDVSKAVLKMDKGMWVDAKSGLFTFTDKQLVINSQSVNDSGKYTIVVSNCFSNVTRDFNLIVGTRPVLAISQNHVSVLCGNAFSVNYTVSGFPVPIVSCCKTQPCADNLCGNNQLFIGNAGISQNGSYSIVADNGFGKDEQTLSVSVRGIHVDPVLPFSESIDCSKSLDVDTIVDVYPFEPITANVVGVSGKVPKLTTSISTEKGSREFCGESVKSFQLVKMTFERQSTVYTGNYSLTVTSSTGLQRVFNFSRAVNSTEDCRPSPPVIEEPETDVCVGSNVDVSVQFQCPSLQLGIKGKGSLELTVPNEEKKTTFESAEDSCQNPVSIKIPKLKQDTQYSYKLVTVASGLNSRSVDGTFITRNDCEVGISWWAWLLIVLSIILLILVLCFCLYRHWWLKLGRRDKGLPGALGADPGKVVYAECGASSSQRYGQSEEEGKVEMEMQSSRIYELSKAKSTSAASAPEYAEIS
eukprot:m.225350 g.225350  ORF g.225350 m.225350 type:complete len:630 (+) comp40013_c0_seq10:39-1928(+)